jgi:hypothetical protein
VQSTRHRSLVFWFLKKGGGVVRQIPRVALFKALVRLLVDSETINTGADKFGSLIGDCSRIEANAVIAPGALLRPETKIGRLQLVDQYPSC